MKTNGKTALRPAPLRVLVADDSSASREDFAAMLSQEKRIEVVGAAAKAIEALSLLENLRPDVVLLNIQMSGRTLLSMLHLIKRATPVPTVIVLTPYPLDVLRERCLDSGADYIFPKPVDFKRLTALLRKLATEKSGVKNQL